jgi:hypothetical protein
MRRLVGMENQWEQLSPEEKREQRFQKWLNPQGITFVSPVVETAYKERVQRLIDAYNIKEPDRVPVVVRTGSIPAYQYGLNYKTVSYDYEKSAQVFNRFNEEHAVDLDSYAVPFAISPGRVLDILDYKLYNWPGHGLPDDSRGYQYVEEEYMKVDEYDAFLKDPSDFWLRTYLPRVFGALGSFRTIKPLTHIIELPMTDFSALARPDVQPVRSTENIHRWPLNSPGKCSLPVIPRPWVVSAKPPSILLVTHSVGPKRFSWTCIAGPIRSWKQ